MPSATASAHSAGMSDINITPLIDVMLVVLVIFMIAIPAISKTLPAELPGHIDNKPPVETTPMLLRIGSDGDFSLDGQPVTRASLPGLLGNANATVEGRPPVLKVQVDDHARYDNVAKALAVAHNAGIDRIVMVR